MLFIAKSLSNEEDLSIARSRDFQRLRHLFTTLRELTISTLRNIYFFKAKLFINRATAMRVRRFLIALSRCGRLLLPSAFFLLFSV
jgi:hypothetical protein